MIVLITLISGAFAGIFARRFRWNARVQNLVGALGAIFCWFVSIYVFGASPGAWTISSVGPNWANFIELLTLLLPLGFAPVIAEKMTTIL
jgi:membrane associated rhomboid family serine protease